jgi:AAA family ATP:ADP antiporter
MNSATENLPVEKAPSLTQRVHQGEWRAVVLSFVYFFCVLTAYYVLRPVREQLSASVGSTQLPWFFMATLAITLVLTPVFSWLAAHWPRRVVVPLVYAFFIVCLLAFVPLFSNQGLLSPRALGTVFFVWVSVFNLFVVSVFWSFMTDIWSNEQARRLFPVIALGGTAGAIVGPILTRQLVGVIGVAPLLVVSAVLLCVSVICVMALGQWARRYGVRRHEVGHEDAVGGGMFDGLKQTFANPFVRAMAALMLLGDAIGTVGYAMVTDYSGHTFVGAVARTQFAAGMDLTTNVLQIVAQLTLTRWLLTRWGAGPVIAFWAVATVVVLVLTMFNTDPYAAVSGFTSAAAEQLVSPMAIDIPVLGFLTALLRDLLLFILVMPWVALPLVISRALAYGMLGPARESLYTRVPRELRYQGKNAVDTAVWRVGDVISASTMNGLRAIGMGVAGIAGLAALAAAASGIVGWRLARRTEKSS